MGSPRAILVVAVLAACGAAFFLLRGRGDGPTDGTGRGPGSGPRGPLAVEGTPPPLAAGPRVSKDTTAEPPAAPTAAAANPAGPEPLDPADRPADWPTTVADGCRTLRLRVRCVDAITGQPVAARWRLGHPFEETLRRGEPVNPTASAPGWWLDPRWRAADLRASVLQRPDTLVHDWIVVDAPAGYADVEQFQIHRPVAADIEEIAATVPLWPTIDLVLTIRGPDGAPAEGARLHAIHVVGGPPEHWAGGTQSSLDAAGTDGVLLVRGLPFVPGAEVRALVAWRPALVQPTESPAAADVEEVELRRPPVLARFPLQPVTAIPVEVRLAGSTGGGEGRARRDLDVPVTEALADEVREEEDVRPPGGPADPATVGRLRVRVRRADGRSAARAQVTCDPQDVFTDADGVAVIGDVAAGEREVWASVPGGFRWTTRVSVDAGARVDVELREPAAGQLDVEVVDDAGRPCPLARIVVLVSGGGWTFDVEDGVQRVDELADAAGRRSYRRTAPGVATVFAEWRWRKGEAKVVVEERGRVTARIVVR